MSKYNPAIDMPTTLDEWNELIDHYFNQGQQKYEAEVASAKARAEAAYAKLPESKDKPALADFIAQAVSMVPPAQTREEWEQHFMSAGYYPQEVPEMPAPTFAELKAQKLSELDSAFRTAGDTATAAVNGMTINADETANRNVSGLITSLEATGSEGPVGFCLADNSFAEVGLADLKAFQLAIIAKGQALYAQKWAMREAIEAAEDEAALAAIAIRF